VTRGSSPQQPNAESDTTTIATTQVPLHKVAPDEHRSGFSLGQHQNLSLLTRRQSHHACCFFAAVSTRCHEAKCRRRF
jgi:hypothetical protein